VEATNKFLFIFVVNVLYRAITSKKVSTKSIRPVEAVWVLIESPSTEPQNHRITEWSGWAGTSAGHPAQPLAQAGSPRAGGTAPCPGGTGISPEKETPQAPLGSLGQGSVTLRGKKFFLGFSWNFLGFSLCPLPLVLALGTPVLFLFGRVILPQSLFASCRNASFW